MHLKLRLLFLFYVAFVIYGSLVPLQYVYIPFDYAVEQFFNIRFLNLGVTSRADWVANGLLFIPLTFLWLASFWREKHNIFNALLVFIALFFSVALPLAIEFTQLYFPARTVSQNDIMAEAIGGVIGIISWFFLKQHFMALISQLIDKTFADKWRVYLTIYLACMLAYSIMPLDLTLSPVELYRKWDKGLLILLPFQFVKQDLITIAYDILADIILWIPVTFFLIRTQSFTTKQIYKRIFLSALLIEFCQIFVFSRYTDVNDLLTALLGAYVGIQIFKRWNNITTEEKSQRVSHSYMGYIGYAVWCCLLVLVYWYPFDFNIANSHVGPALRKFFSVPFASYYIGSEYLAITQLFRKILFAIPLGIFLAIILAKHPLIPVIVKRIIVSLVLFLTVFFFELVQMLVPIKTANLTDVIVSFVGALMGYNGIKPLLAKFLIATNREHDIQQNKQQTIEKSNYQSGANQQISTNFLTKLGESLPIKVNYLPIIFKILLLYIAILSAYFIPSMPYNVKELYAGGGILGAIGLTLVLLNSFGFPMAAIQLLAKKERLNRKQLIGYFLLHIAIAWLLIRIFIPFEAIYDIVGYPTWGVVFEVELAFRFLGFFSVISATMFLAALSFTNFPNINQYNKTRLKINAWLMFLLIVIPFNFLVVVVLAGTDNIIELLPNEGYSFYCLFIVLYFMVTFFLATKLSISIKLKRFKQTLLLTLVVLITTPIMYFCLQLGTENYVVKYKKVFSALQFLLSTDRKHYAETNVLMIRFAIAHIGFIALFIFTQWYQNSNTLLSAKHTTTK